MFGSHINVADFFMILFFIYTFLILQALAVVAAMRHLTRWAMTAQAKMFEDLTMEDVHDDDAGHPTYIPPFA